MSAETLVAELCAKIGKRIPVWTQGQGGNVSVKDAATDTIFVKATGLRLDRVQVGRGIAAASLSSLRANLSALAPGSAELEPRYAQLLGRASLDQATRGRLSMECGFHALLEARCVLHFHSLAAVLMCHEQASNPGRWNEWLADAGYLRFTVLAVVTPGADLSLAVGRAPASEAYLLKNHGVILAASDPWELLERWEKFEIAFCRRFFYSEILGLLEEKEARPEALARETSRLAVLLPDVAVFEERIRNVTEGAGETLRLAANAWELDRDAAELWVSVQALLRAAPSLEELPTDLAKKLPVLPAELVRKKGSS